ncbi:MAG TPA: 30S ribosomal protein S16 [Candidatus Paceibacterota bacterium]
MLKIRLQRVGRKNVPNFRVVLTESQNSTKSGKYLEILGNYDPVHKTKALDGERIKYWISKGAQASETMNNFLINEKIVSGKKVNVLPLKKKTFKRKELKAKAGEKKSAPAAAPAGTPAPEAPKTEVKAPEAAPEVKATAAETPKQ